MRESARETGGNPVKLPRRNPITMLIAVVVRRPRGEWSRRAIAKELRVKPSR